MQPDAIMDVNVLSPFISSLFSFETFANLDSKQAWLPNWAQSAAVELK